MERIMVLYGAVFVLIAGCYCLPSKRMFLDVDCNKKFDCDSKANETDADESDELICATDGHTYNSKCHLDEENQRRYCVIGDFNPVAIVHKGNCTDVEESDMLW